MFLSTLGKFLLFAPLCAGLLTACGASQSSINTEVAPIPEQKSEFPFSTKEPETYQADVVVTSNGAEDRFFVARKGDKWRRDHFSGPTRSITELRTGDGVYLIDHRKKTYSAEPAEGNDVTDLDPSSVSFFRGKEYRDFDEVERGGGIVRYEGRKGETSQDDIVITIDEPSGMIVRQEFTSAGGESFAYELRDLKLDVDDSIFQIPAGYRKVALSEIRTAPKTK
jgi:outer membrane lipoprotein-sorting protein